jgi:protein-export membrane protein SecD
MARYSCSDVLFYAGFPDILGRMFKVRYVAILLLIAAALIGFFVYTTQVPGGRFAFKLGLDLSGGTHLVYNADTSTLPQAQVADSMEALQQVIERRVNAFGVGEPVVQTEQSGALGNGAYRLIVELPGVTDVNQAIAMIGQTPLLEFKLVKNGESLSNPDGTLNQAAFEETGLTGKYLQSAALQFGSGAVAVSAPAVLVNFNSEGSVLFRDITSKHVGRQLAIFLDGKLLSAPVLQERIDNGSAVVSGNFTATEAKDLVTNLNLGALPVPITLASTQTIGATLGDEATRAGVAAGVLGFLALSLFMILWYRLPGLVAVASLFIYCLLMLALFKLIPVVLTAAGIAGFILSVGLAVDANVLIAERIKEELADGKKTEAAIREGFARAWLAIRDSNIAHIIAAIILFWFGTALIKGFALVFGLGVVVSMFSAISISRTFLLALGVSAEKGVGRFLMLCGLHT